MLDFDGWDVLVILITLAIIGLLLWRRLFAVAAAFGSFVLATYAGFIAGAVGSSAVFLDEIFPPTIVEKLPAELIQELDEVTTGLGGYFVLAICLFLLSAVLLVVVYFTSRHHRPEGHREPRRPAGGTLPPFGS